MDYSQFFGYSPLAPQYATGTVAAPPSAAEAPTLVGPATFGANVSGNFAVAGWLAAIIIGLAAYRYLWERAG